MNLGDKIKKARLEQGLKQTELASGICTQATISNLENNTSIPTLVILFQIGTRLNLELSELSEYAIEQISPTVVVFKQVQALRSQFKLKEACDLLKDQLKFEDLKTNQEKKQYYYYLGITSLLGYNEISDAQYNFQLGLNLETDKQREFLDILLTNGIGLAYFMNSEEDKALTYFEKSMVELDQFVNQTNSLRESIEIMKLYYTSAKFYSAIKQYAKALNLCDLGIALQKREHANYDLDRLYYEKAFNLVHLGELQGAKDYYYYAGALSKLSGNKILSEVIEKDREAFNMGQVSY